MLKELQELLNKDCACIFDYYWDEDNLIIEPDDYDLSIYSSKEIEKYQELVDFLTNNAKKHTLNAYGCEGFTFNDFTVEIVHKIED